MRISISFINSLCVWHRLERWWDCESKSLLCNFSVNSYLNGHFLRIVLFFFLNSLVFVAKMKLKHLGDGIWNSNESLEIAFQPSWCLVYLVGSVCHSSCHLCHETRMSKFFATKFPPRKIWKFQQLETALLAPMSDKSCYRSPFQHWLFQVNQSRMTISRSRQNLLRFHDICRSALSKVLFSFSFFFFS